MSETGPLTVVQSWPWGNQIADKKQIKRSKLEGSMLQWLKGRQQD